MDPGWLAGVSCGKERTPCMEVDLYHCLCDHYSYSNLWCVCWNIEEFILIGALGWVFIPGLPSYRNAWYLTEEEKEYAATRLGQPKEYTWDKTVFKRVLLSWQFWLLPTIFMRKPYPALTDFAESDEKMT